MKSAVFLNGVTSSWFPIKRGVRTFYSDSLLGTF